MKIAKALEQIDVLYPNTYGDKDKIEWLSELDKKIYREVIKTHEDAEIESFEGYDETTSLETELLADTEYEELYITWLMTKIDYFNRQWESYNNGANLFNTQYTDYTKNYNRTHMPIKSGNWKV